MTDQLTDEAVTKLANDCVLAANCMEAEDTFPTGQAILREAARALLDARAENARLRADAQAAVALVVERAADACVALADQVSDAALTGLPEQARLRESMEAAFTKASHIIRALAPADGLAAVEALRKERDLAAAQNDRLWAANHNLVAEQDALFAELAAVQQREAGLTDAVERLVVVLDRNDKKGPIPDVEMMFCWLAAQDIRAALAEVQADARREGGE